MDDTNIVRPPAVGLKTENSPPGVIIISSPVSEPFGLGVTMVDEGRISVGSPVTTVFHPADQVACTVPRK